MLTKHFVKAYTCSVILGNMLGNFDACVIFLKKKKKKKKIRKYSNHGDGVK